MLLTGCQFVTKTLKQAILLRKVFSGVRCIAISLRFFPPKTGALPTLINKGFVFIFGFFI